MARIPDTVRTRIIRTERGNHQFIKLPRCLLQQYACIEYTGTTIYNVLLIVYSYIRQHGNWNDHVLVEYDPLARGECSVDMQRRCRF